MASTNPLQQTEQSQPSNTDGENAPIGRRLRMHGRRASRRGKKRNVEEVLRGETGDLGLPHWEGLRPVASFLVFPALFAFAIIASGGGWPPLIMYSIAGCIGLFIALSTFKGVELVFACILFYIPFSKTYAIPIAPLVNGTNIMILMGLFASIMQAANKRQFWFGWPPGTTLVAVFAFFTCFSAVTLLRLPGGLPYLLYTEFVNYKSWVDQFLLMFVALCCIRDVQIAKRVWVYLMIGSALVVLFTVPEFFDKAGRSTIEKSRLVGPHFQSNNFGGFVAYTTLPLVAFFIVFLRDLRTWIITPYFLVCAKILITTFSRGAYIAFAAGCLFSGYLKSGRFLVFWALFAVSTVAIFPQILPESVLARLGDSTAEKVGGGATTESLDRSSEVRLIMWRAAARMILESPILGKGFKAFPKLKENYTEQFVEESDPHSMYLYLGSQMGLPSVILFLFIMGSLFFMGMKLARSPVDRFSRSIGIGGASASVCYAIVCIFGSRAVNADFTLYFWTYFVVISVLYRDLIKNKGRDPHREYGKRRMNAFVAKAEKQQAEVESVAASAAIDTGGGANQLENDSERAPGARKRHINARESQRAARKASKERLGSRRNR